MKIVNVRTLVVNAHMRNWVFVKVETDQSGLHGWGEATLEWKTNAVVGCVEDFRPLLLGEDPTRIEYLYQKLYRHSFFRMGAIGMSAISGIEQACWDILGKELGVPVYRLLGGAARDKVRMYTHLGGGQMENVYETFDPGPLVELAQQVVERGYSAVKVVFVPYSEPLMGAPAADRLGSLMRALREGVGDEVDIMVDFHGRSSPAMAVQYINALAPYRPFFCEEPVPPENTARAGRGQAPSSCPDSDRRTASYSVPVPRHLRAAGSACDSADLCHCGGLLEARKIAAMAETYYMGGRAPQSAGADRQRRRPAF